MRRHVSCLWALYPHPRQPHPLGAAAHRVCGAIARAAVLDPAAHQCARRRHIRGDRRPRCRSVRRLLAGGDAGGRRLVSHLLVLPPAPHQLCDGCPRHLAPRSAEALQCARKPLHLARHSDARPADHRNAGSQCLRGRAERGRVCYRGHARPDGDTVRRRAGSRPRPRADPHPQP